MAASNGIFNALDRKTELSAAKPARHTSLRTVADTISKRNVDAAVVELFNEALSRLLLLAYEEDAGGLCNVDVVTGKFLIPLPFGRNGHSAWGLRPTEANVLRQILFDWRAEGRCLFYFENSHRAWFVSLYDYPDAAAAKSWLRAHQITIALYRSARAKRAGKV